MFIVAGLLLPELSSLLNFLFIIHAAHQPNSMNKWNEDPIFENLTTLPEENDTEDPRVKITWNTASNMVFNHF